VGVGDADCTQLRRGACRASIRAALIYQHATSKRDHEIAAALDTLILNARKAAQDVEDALLSDRFMLYISSVSSGRRRSITRERIPRGS
jgi:hypothetical protein